MTDEVPQWWNGLAEEFQLDIEILDSIQKE